MTNDTRVMKQIFGYGVRAVVAALQAAGPAELLPTIGVGFGSPGGGCHLSQVQVRRELWDRSQRHLDLMQESIDYEGEGENQ